MGDAAIQVLGVRIGRDNLPAGRGGYYDQLHDPVVQRRAWASLIQGQMLPAMGAELLAIGV